MPAKGTTTERGYDNGHKVNRARMLYNLVDGTKCTYCGKPMYREAALNFDQAPLEADHKHGDKSSPAYRLSMAQAGTALRSHKMDQKSRKGPKGRVTCGNDTLSNGNSNN